MGTVIDLTEWRREREPLELRLERAVQRLDQTLEGAARESAPRWLVTEVLAIQGCISMDLLEEAAERAERVADAWRRRERRSRRRAAAT